MTAPLEPLGTGAMGAAGKGGSCMRACAAWTAPAIQDGTMPPRMGRKVRAKLVSAVWRVLLAVVVIGLVPMAGRSAPNIVSFGFSGGNSVSVEAGPGLKRQSDTLVANLVVQSDTNYSIRVEVQPTGLRWADVVMNTGHPGIDAGNEWSVGFDVAITAAGGDPLAPAGLCKAGTNLDVWCMGSVSRQHMIGTPGTETWDVHVRMVLVDEVDESAGFVPSEDPVRFTSLPSNPSTEPLEVTVAVVVEQWP